MNRDRPHAAPHEEDLPHRSSAGFFPRVTFGCQRMTVESGLRHLGGRVWSGHSHMVVRAGWYYSLVRQAKKHALRGRIMRCSTLLSAIPLVIFVTANDAGEPKLPDPPKGFTWKRVDEIKASFLMPEGWHFLLHKQGNSSVICISQDKIEKFTSLETGLMVRVLHGLGKLSAEEFTKKTMDFMAKRMKVSKRWDINQGEFKGHGCLVTNSNADRPPFTMHTLALANTTTNTFYNVHFESSEKNWNENWKKHGEVIMKLFSLDDVQIKGADKKR
jgi:hypothetical protein